MHLVMGCARSGFAGIRTCTPLRFFFFSPPASSLSQPPSRTGTVSMYLALAKPLDSPILHGDTQILIRDDGKSIEIDNSHLQED